MTVRECYAAIGGNYEEAFNRLRSDDRLIKFLNKLPDDPTFGMLEGALDTGDAELAFRAAHTLKGVGLNLSLTDLYESASALTESLRGKTVIDAAATALFATLKARYDLTIQCIKTL